MTAKRMDNVGIVVEGFDAAIAFFTENRGRPFDAPTPSRQRNAKARLLDLPLA